MSETPSKRRRKGREAFDGASDPMDVQPYKKGSFAYRYHLPDWLDGWEEAKCEYEKETIMKEFEIYYRDLTPEAQQNYLDFAEAEYAEELNCEYIPIAIIEMDTEGV